MAEESSNVDVNSREYWQAVVSNPKEYGLTGRGAQAMSESLDLTNPEHWKKVRADPEAHGFNAEQARQLGEQFVGEKDVPDEFSPEEKTEAEAGLHIGNYGDYGDKHVHAWLSIGDVSPLNAALLFFGKNPSKYKSNLPDFGESFDLMKWSFDDAARDGHSRSLNDWLILARSRNLNAVGLDGWEACATIAARDTDTAPEQDAATTAPGVAARDAPVIPKNQRPDLLAPLIEKAQRGESDPYIAAVIWPKLCSMAESKTRPLIGVSDEGIKWTDGNDPPQFLTKKALSDRLRRMKKCAI